MNIPALWEHFDDGMDGSIFALRILQGCHFWCQVACLFWTALDSRGVKTGESGVLILGCPRKLVNG